MTNHFLRTEPFTSWQSNHSRSTFDSRLVSLDCAIIPRMPNIPTEKTLMNPDKSRLNPSYSSFSSAGWWLSHPSEKYESQLGWWHSQYKWKKESANSRVFSWLKLPHRRHIAAPPSQALRELADAPSGSSSGSPSGAAPSGEVTLMKHIQKLAGGFNPSEKIFLPIYRKTKNSPNHQPENVQIGVSINGDTP